MSTDTPAVVEAETGRPRSVDYAVYAIIAECVLSILAALSLFGERSWLVDQWHKNNTYPGLSDAQLHKKFNDFTHQAFVVAIIIGLLLILLAKFLRDGKNWARWTFVIFTVVPGLPTAYLFNITNFLYNVPATYRILSGLTGVAALAAIVFLFLKPSRPYFRKPGAGAPVSPFAALLRGRSAPRPATPATPTPTPTPTPSQPAGTANSEASPVPARPARGKARGADSPDSSASVAPEAPPVTTPAGAKRPRAKSRKTAE